MIDLGYVFRRAWKVTWRHKALWLFGFLISLGTVGARFVAGSSSRWEQLVRELPPGMERLLSDFLSSPYFAVAMVALVLLALVVGVGLALLNALGRAALVDQVRAAEVLGMVDLRAGWRQGSHHLWTVFLIRLVLGLPVAVMALAGALPVIGMSLVIARQTQPEVLMPGVFFALLAFSVCLFPSICLAVLLSVPLSVLQRLAVRACVLEGHGVRAAIVRAWAVLREYLGPLVLLWLVLLGVGIGVMIVIGLPLMLVAVVLMAIALLTMFVSPLLFIALTMIIGLLAWLVGAGVNGVAETFTSVAWTLAYRELAGLGLTGKEKASAV
jgi:hypothetical protein